MLGRAVISLEISRASRKAATFYTRTIYLSLMATLVVITWLYAQSTGNTWRQREVSAYSIFSTLVWFEYVSVIFIAIVNLCDCFARERRQKTLPLLLASPMSSFDIVVGKLIGGMIQPLYLLIGAMPIIVVLQNLGSISLHTVGALLVGILAACMVTASMSVLCSLLFRRFPLTLGFSAAAAIFLQILLVGLDETYELKLSVPTILSSGFAIEQSDMLVALSISAVVFLFTLLASVICLHSIRRKGSGSGLSKGKRKRNSQLSQQDLERIYATSRNPFFVRTNRSLLHAAKLFWVRSLYLCAIAFIVAYITNLSPDIPLQTLPMIALLAVLLVSAIFGARSISGERTRRTLAPLLSSPVNSEIILEGKARQTVSTVLPCASACITIACTLAAMNELSMLYACICAAVSTTYIIFGSLLGVSVAVISDKRWVNVAACVLVVMLLQGGLYAAGLIAGAAGAEISPEHLAPAYWCSASWFGAEHVWYVTDFTRMLFIHLALMLLAAFLVLRLSIRLFDRCMGRL